MNLTLTGLDLKRPIPRPRTGSDRVPVRSRGKRNDQWGLALALFVLYSVVSIREHTRLRTYGFDLGLLEQSVRSYAHGQLPHGEILGPHYPLLGDHFSPIVATMAPFYRVFPSPITLLMVQAALLAVASVPLVGWAQRVAGRGAGVVVGLAFGCSWGVAQMVEFDAHEVAFAVPLVSFSVCALGQRRLVAAVAWALPLLLVKEDLGVTVAVIGLFVWRLGRKRLGLTTAAVGIAASALTVLMILPALNPNGVYAHTDAFNQGHGTGYLAGLTRITTGLVTPEPKAILLVLLLAPTGFLALRSPLLLVGVPTLGWRLLSDHWSFWAGHFHYNAILMPIVFAAFIDAMRRCRANGARDRIAEGLVVASVITAVLVPCNSLATPFRSATWQHDPRIADSAAVLARIPDGATVAATNTLAPHLTSRTIVCIYGWTDDKSKPDWIVADRAMVDPLFSGWPFSSRAGLDAALNASRAAGYRDVLSRGDFVLLRRDAAAVPTS